MKGDANRQKTPPEPQCTDHTETVYVQGRNHVFKVGGPIPWSRVLLPFHTKKLHRSTQFGTVDYIITLYSSKSYVKSWGVRPNSGEVWTPDLPVVAPMSMFCNCCYKMRQKRGRSRQKMPKYEFGNSSVCSATNRALW